MRLPTVSTLLLLLPVLLREIVCGIFLTLPIALFYSQCEKRFLVHCKETLSYCKLYRIVGFVILHTFIFTFVPSATTTTIAGDLHIIRKIIFNLSRNIFIVLGIYIGGKFCPVAITGSIATGKSTVVKILLEKYVFDSTKEMKMLKMFRIIDTDTIGHDILLSSSQLSLSASVPADDRLVHANDSVYSKILKAFGDSQIHDKNILTDENEIDRRKLGDLIFQDPTKRRILNRITHPQIIRIMVQQLLIGTYVPRHNKSYICADVPLLYESGSIRWLFSCIIVVACSPDIQYERLRKRNTDLNETQCRQRIASQIPIEQKVSRADIVIWNNSTHEDLSKEIHLAINELQRRIQHGQFSLLEIILIIGGLIPVVNILFF